MRNLGAVELKASLDYASIVDTEEAIKKTGEICGPITRGVISEKDIVADMFAVVRGEAQGRGGRDEITLFKSAGSALLDLATAALAYERA